MKQLITELKKMCKEHLYSSLRYEKLEQFKQPPSGELRKNSHTVGHYAAGKINELELNVSILKILKINVEWE